MSPGPRWPAALQQAAWVFRPFAFLEHCRRRYGTPFTLRFPENAAIFVTDAPGPLRAGALPRAPRLTLRALPLLLAASFRGVVRSPSLLLATCCSSSSDA